MKSDAKPIVIESLVRPEIQALSAYHVPDASGLLKLDAMENPNPWPGDLKTEWLQVLAATEANRYPDPSASKVKRALRRLMSLEELELRYPSKLDILLGNGSDEIIQILALALANSERPIMAPEPSFVMYAMIAKFVGMPYVGVNLKPDFELDVEAFVAAINHHNPALIFLALPNNPTGNVFQLDQVRRVIESAQGLVVIDEAYIAFTDSDLLALCAEYDNVVVMRTLSKVGLAGLRLGFLVGQQAWLDQFDKVRLPYNINVLTQASVEFAVQHYAVLSQQTDRLRQQREWLFNQLVANKALEVYPSEANFILLRCRHAKQVFTNMKAQGVLVKCLDGGHPLLNNCLRLTVGNERDNELLLAALTTALAAT